MSKNNGRTKVYAIALDPGGTTGVATVLYEEDPWAIQVAQLSGEHHLELLIYLHDMVPEQIICEEFYNVGNEAARLASSEIIGVVKCYAQAAECPVVWQSPATGKQFWTDLRLKQCGIYIPGMQHARDAIRHYAHWRLFTVNDRAILRQDQAKPTGSVFRLPPS